MDIIKKIGAVLASVLITVVRFPLTWIACALNLIDFGLVKLDVILTKKIDCDWYTEAMYEAMGVNTRGFEYIAEYFEDLQEDLA